MMSATMTSSLVQAPMVSRRPVARSARSPMVVRASQETSRRGALSALAGVLGLSVAAAAQAKVVIPIHDSIGDLPKNSSEASMSGYTMEGTKKRGINATKKKAVMAAAKEAALAGLNLKK